MKTNWLIPAWTVIAMIQTYNAGMSWNNWILRRGLERDYGNLFNQPVRFTDGHELVLALMTSASAVLVWVLVIWKVRSRDRKHRTND